MKRLGGSVWYARSLCSVVSLFALALCPPLSMARSDVDWSVAGDLNVRVGQMWLDDSEWSPVESQRQWGAEIDFTKSTNWAGAVIGFSYSKEDGTTSGSNTLSVDSRWVEVDVGARKIFYNVMPRVRPFAGLGAAIFSADVEITSPTAEANSDEAVGFGGYGEVGAYIDVYGPFHLGGLLRYSKGRINLFGSTKDPGGLTICAMLGIHWFDF